MTATDIKSSFRALDLNERIKLLGGLWGEVSTEPTLFDLSDEVRRELERRFNEHHESSQASRSSADLVASLRGCQ